MKKVAVIITISLIISIIVVIPLNLALESCHNQVIIGDPNDDGKIDLTDGIYILNYLYLGGSAPLCIEAADFNEDSTITIADAIKLFKFLFQGGSAPVNFYFEGLNDAPQLGFIWTMSLEDLEKEEEFEIPEIRAQIPTTVFFGDSSGEEDIKECSVTALELDSAREPIGNAKTIFDSEWHLDPSFQGKEISKNPLAFVPGYPDILPGATYQIDVTCIDNIDQSDTIKMLLTPIAPAPPPFCTSPDTCCVCVEGSGCNIEPEFNRRCLGAEDTNGDSIPDRSRSCDELGGPSDPPTYRGVWREDPMACNSENPQEGEGGGGTESTTDPLEPPKGPCKVKGLTILKKGDPIPSDIPLPPEYSWMTTPLSRSQTIIQLGHNEGWSQIDSNEGGLPEIQYKFGYAFIVLAHLTVGSDPNSCPEGQFAQESHTILNYDPTTGTLSPQILTRKIPGFMFSLEEILNLRTMGDLEGLGLLIDLESIKQKQIETDPVEGCPFNSNGGGKWCIDDYIYERGAPGDKYKEWTFFSKKHKEDTDPPKILWYDNPGDYHPLINIVNGFGEGYPWLRITRNIKIEKRKTYTPNIISIVEDFGSEHRFYCEMIGLTFDNQPSKVTFNQKMQVTEPTCNCIEQEWRGNQWENKGEPKMCGIGSKSFIQAL